MGIEVDAKNMDSIRSAVALLQTKLEAKMVMVTLSEHGVFIKDNGDTHLIPAHIRQISDVSGRGVGIECAGYDQYGSAGAVSAVHCSPGAHRLLAALAGCLGGSGQLSAATVFTGG